MRWLLIALASAGVLLSAALADAYVHTGRRGEAVALPAEMEKRRATQYVSPMDFAYTYSALGDTDSVFERFDKAYGDQSEMLLFLKIRSVLRRAARRSAIRKAGAEN